MFKRFSIVTALGVFLSVLFASTASASHIGFTINGVPDHQGYQCVAPCTVQAHDPDGGSYDWDFESDRHSTFVVQATGNPVSWTYQQAGAYTITQRLPDGSLASASVNVIPAEESAPEDIELVSTASGTLPLELEFTTSRRQIRYLCGGCRGEQLDRTGPDRMVLAGITTSCC